MINIREKELVSIFLLQTSNAVSDSVNVKNADYLLFQIGTPASTDGTIKIRKSLDPSVDLSSAKSNTNIWDYAHIYNLENPGAGVAGSAGITPAGAIQREYKINIDPGVAQVAFEITGMSAGSYTVNLKSVSTNGK